MRGLTLGLGLCLGLNGGGSNVPSNAWRKSDGTAWRKPDGSYWLKAA